MGITIRKATEKDIDAVNEIYDHIHTEHEKGATYTGWVRGVYPKRETAKDAVSRGDLFVEEDGGKIVGTAIINKNQGEVYKGGSWKHIFPDDEIMVLHTLVIDPYIKGHGYGKSFVGFYEEYAKENGCKCLRMDTNELNKNARSFYNKLGYSEAGILPCVFNGIPGIRLVMLEKVLK